MNVIITGATRGIGRALAEVFAHDGYNLIVSSRSAENLEMLKKQFQHDFPRVSVSAKVADIGKVNEIKNFGKWIIEKGFAPDILINNAGYFTPSTILNEDDGLIEKMLDVNLKGAYYLTRSLLPKMVERKRGHIFNICSIASISPLANVGAYGISKFALYGFTKHLREEMKPHGIKVTAVVPGATYTSSWDGSGIDSDRLMQAEDIAKMVLAATHLSSSAVVEDIIIRPQLGDL